MARSRLAARPVMAMTSDCSSGAGTWMFTYGNRKADAFFVQDITQQGQPEEKQMQFRHWTQHGPWMPTDQSQPWLWVYLELIHHLANSTSFLPNDVPMKVKGHLYLNGHRNQRLQGREKCSGLCVDQVPRTSGTFCPRALSTGWKRNSSLHVSRSQSHLHGDRHISDLCWLWPRLRSIPIVTAVFPQHSHLQEVSLLPRHSPLC